MGQTTRTRMVKVVSVYTTWLLLLLAAGVLLLRGDGLRLIGFVPWLTAVVVAMAGCDELEDLRRERLGRFIARSAFALMGVLLVVALAAGPPSYLTALGQRGTALVTEVRAADPDQPYRACRVSLDATGQDLGWLPAEQCEGSRPGDRIEVSYDPRGWAAPMTADALPGSDTGAAVMLLWLLTAAGTAVTAVAVTAADLQSPAPGPVPL